MGIAGLGATLPVLYEKLVKTGKLPLEKLMTMLSTNPAKLMQLHPKLGAIEIGSTAKLIIMQKEPLSRPIPIIPSQENTFNVWQDFTHTLNYSYIEA
jgi:dihydroorotase-like cyclic amidohydrolase